MRTFELFLQGARQFERIDAVTSFVGEDATGSFALRAHHERFMSALVFGLARYRLADGDWHYLALPGALLYFVDNRLFINTRRYIADTDYNRISQALTEQLLREEEVLMGLKRNLRQLEEAMMRQLLAFERGR
jgi:F-type H+-transporting ATPase subunit epsilon